jgi:ribosomal protein L40E
MDWASAQALIDRYGTEFLIYLGVALLGGLLLGTLRGRVLRGAIFGLLLGPIGWWLIWRWEYGGHQCPECGGLNSPRAKVCRHCKVDLRKAADRTSRSRIHAKSDGWR